MEYLAKVFDNTTNTWKDKLDVKIPNWGMTYPVKKQLDLALRGIDGEEDAKEEVDVEKRGVGDDIFDTVVEAVSSAAGYYDRLIKTFVKLGYTENKDIVSAPYDWRNQPYEGWMVDTKKLIEKTYEENEKKPVVLVAHSYGNIMTYLFLIGQDQAWKDKYVHHYVAASPAYMGSPKAFVLGFTYTILDVSPKIPIYMKAMGENFRNVPSLYSLMPYAKAYGDKYFIFETYDGKYTIDEIPKIFTKAGVEEFDAKWEVSRSMMSKHNEEYNITPGVSTTIFYTTSIKSTYYKVVCPTKRFKELLNYTDWIGSGLCNVVFDEGDGTITKDSLLYPYEKHWKKSNDGHAYKIREIAEADHTSLISKDEFLKGVGGIVGIKEDDVSEILKYNTSLMDTAAYFGKFLGVTFVVTLIVACLSSLIFSRRLCPCSEFNKEDGTCCCSAESNQLRIYITAFALSLGTFVLIVISLSKMTWLHVENDGDVYRFGLKEYTLYNDKDEIKRLEGCTVCGDLYNSGKAVYGCGIFLLIVLGLLVLISAFRLVIDCMGELKINEPAKNTTWNMIYMLVGIIVTVIILATSFDYFKKASKLSVDKYSKSYHMGLPCYISAIIPAITMTILFASEIIGNTRIVASKREDSKDIEMDSK